MDWLAPIALLAHFIWLATLRPFSQKILFGRFTAFDPIVDCFTWVLLGYTTVLLS